MPTKRDHEPLPDILQQLRERGDGYVAPGEDYFARMAERALRSAQAPAKQRRLTPRFYAVAAGMLLLLVAAWWKLAGPQQDAVAAVTSPRPSSAELLADIDPEIIDAYISEQIDAFTVELYTAAPVQE